MRWPWHRRNSTPSPNGTDRGKIEAQEALRDSHAKLRDADELTVRARRARRRLDLLAEDLRRSMGPSSG